MSVNYSIYCKDHKLDLWIGQGSRCLYTGEKHIMNILKEFLFSHAGCDLEFNTENKYLDDEDYIRIHANEDGTLDIYNYKMNKITIKKEDIIGFMDEPNKYKKIFK